MSRIVESAHFTKNGRTDGQEKTKKTLKIVQQPPSFVFSEEWFDVGLDLSSTSDISSSYIELGANLHRYVNDDILPQPAQDNQIVDLHLLVNDQSETTLATGVKTKIANCKIKSPEPEDETPITYCLKFFFRSRQTGAVLDEIEQACSVPVQIVKYKLCLFSEWESDVFYKDEGGKEKCLRVKVKLYDQNGDIVRGTHLPLRIRLLYDDKDSNVVLKQHDTLRLLGATKHFIDPENGEAIIKFRIEDVSKNHQGLKFKLEVSPDERRSSDIAPGTSKGVIVRSKRNKRQQQSPSRRKTSHGDIPVQFGAPGDAAYTSHSSPGSSHDSSIMKRQDRRNIEPREAINEIMGWSNEVAKLLPSLKWNLIGYCQCPDGSADYTKPNHIMPYPNDCISRIMNNFSDVNRCLYTLKDSIDKGTIHPPQEGNGGRRGERGPPPLPDQYYGVKNDYDLSPQSPYYATPVTPQTLPQNYTSTRPPPLLHPGILENDNRKRQRHDAEVHWSPAQRPDENGWQDEATKDVEYILAKHFQKLGFPVYNSNKVIIGFYRESNTEIGVGQFSPLSQHKDELGLEDIAEANHNLNEALAQKSQALHCKKDWGSVVSMFDHAMVYDWSADFK